MPVEGIESVAVVGAGVMGHGIAQVFAMRGYRVRLIDISEEILRRALERIRWSLEKLASRGRIPRASIEESLSRITTYVDAAEGLRGADFVVEAVPEDIEVKRQVFREASRHASPNAPIVSNTSGLPITALAEAVDRPERVAGMHWFNPPQLMDLIEVVTCKYTGSRTLELVEAVARDLGKTPVLVRRDIRGFIANRVNRAIRYESLLMFRRGEYRPEEIDSAFRYRLGAAMGPFELLDFTGGIEIELSEDRFFGELRSRYPEWEPHDEYVMYRSAAIEVMRERAEAGLIGVKTGRGFYEYPEPGRWAKVSIPREAGERVDLLSVLSPAINLAAWLVRNRVATPEEIDTAMKLGLRFPKGLLEIAREHGADAVKRSLEEKLRRWGGEPYSAFYRPDPGLNEAVAT